MNKPIAFIILSRIFIFSLLVLISISGFSQWTRKADLTGVTRYEAVGFSIYGKGYIGTGTDVSGRKKDFWEYDPSTDTWSQKADFGGTARFGAVGFAIRDKGYIGTGIDGITGSRKDFWQYDPSTNTWLQKADFGGSSRWGAAGFSIWGKGYIGTGNADGVFKKDFWEYDDSTNTWQQKTDFGGLSRWLATGFSIGDKGYLGTGHNGTGVGSKDFWEYDPSTNSWLRKADFGGTPRNAAVGFSMDYAGYIGTGNDGSFRKDFWQYNLSTDSWSQKPDFGGIGRDNAVGFSIGSKGYIGTGFFAGRTQKDLWEYTECIPVTYYRDADNDGYGSSLDSIPGNCNPPAGWVSNRLDCNDGDSTVHLGATEICNGIDDNCNGVIDENNLAVFTGGDQFLYFGYLPEQCVSVTAYVVNGVAPYSYQWTLDRPLLSDVVTPDGDESMSGVNSQTVTVCLLDTAVLCVTVTDANGCPTTSCLTIYASDVRCFTGNNDNTKVTMCHHGSMICVSENAIAGHIGHGDYVGPCAASRAVTGVTAIEQSLKPGLSVYPNPNKGDMFVTMNFSDDEMKNAIIQLINVNGQIVKQTKVNNQRRLNFGIKETGVYFIKLVTGKQVYTRKVTVVR